MDKKAIRNKIQSLFKESYGCETPNSGFAEKETLPPTIKDRNKVKEIINDTSLPEVAENGKAFVVKWADGRGIFACKNKSYLTKWLDKVGSWAEIIRITYKDPEDLKVITESTLTDPYGMGPCPHCGEFAKGTFRHRGAPVFCNNHHKWGGTCGHDKECQNTPLNEMPAWNDRHKNITANFQTDFNKTSQWLKQGNFKEIETFNVVKGYKAIIFSRNNDTYYVLVHENYLGREIVGEFVWRKDEHNHWQTESAAVLDEHQGKGIGYVVYDYMIECYLKTLYSDKTLTGEEGHGSFNIWDRLSRKLNSYLYNSKDKTYTPVKHFSKDMMGDERILFVVSVEEIPISEPIEELNGGLADGMSIKDIANKHEVSPSTIRNQVNQGKDVEQEHTDDLKIATDIAKDHEVENPKYYDDLKKAGIDEENLKEMPYLDNTPNTNGTTLDLQIEKWSSLEEFSQFLMKLFRGENYSDEKQPNIQMRNPRELLDVLTHFSQDLNNPTTQFLIQFTRKFNSGGKNVTLKTINRKQINYWMAFIINAYNKAKEIGNT